MCTILCYYYNILCLLVKRRKEVTAEEKENILLVLTNDGYLKVMSADTGSVLRSIFLSTITKYRYVHMLYYACTQLLTCDTYHICFYIYFMNFMNSGDFVKIKLWNSHNFNVWYVESSRSNLVNFVLWNILLMNTLWNINLVNKRASMALPVDHHWPPHWRCTVNLSYHIRLC